ncbi:ferredoxin reductase family protein [Desulfovibrio inopinatus]|uniref:ferredoxin reductase family protein n=1 Tax=Desulfovibrio inopinatus TaxID=102109 RepID=UPI0004267572|nr:ferredoxin reductase family protein [Desulfovibrio inopinatus]
MLRGVLLIAAYIGVAIIPLVVAGAFVPGGDNFAEEFAKALGLAGLALLGLQPLIVARLKSICRPFGLDMVIRFHRFMALLAVVFLACHPVFLAIGHNSPRLLISIDLPWYIWAGKITLVLVIVQILTSIFRKKIGWSFERWRTVHMVVGPLLLLAGLTHAVVLADGALRFAVIALVGVGLCAFLFWRFVNPRRLARSAYTVANLVQETPTVRTLNLVPAEGAPRYDFLPGQFHFLTIHSAGLPLEEHHFTISSSPTTSDGVASTIKACGDFTSALGQVKPGDRVIVDGGYGRFSYVLHPTEHRFLFIAGGIGITPLMSMLRHMRDSRFSGPVNLMYANRTQADIVFADELADMVAAGRPRLRVEHVLSQPDTSWSGRTGRIDKDLLADMIPKGHGELGVYVCGPTGMRTAVVAALVELGIPQRRIHSEEFVLLD